MSLSVIDYCQMQQEYFLPGAIVQCTTCLGDVVKGEVTAFDRHKKLLILKSTVLGGKQQIQFVNLSFVKDINIIKEQTAAQQSLHQHQQQTNHFGSHGFNDAKIQRRKQEEIDRKRRSVASVKISPSGQTVFLAIRKTIDDIRWDQESIVVFEKVVVRPPYKPDNVSVYCSNNNKSSSNNTKSGSSLNNSGNINSSAESEHVKKIVIKAWSSLNANELAVNMNSSSSLDSNNNKSPPIAANASSSSHHNNNNSNENSATATKTTTATVTSVVNECASESMSSIRNTSNNSTAAVFSSTTNNNNTNNNKISNTTSNDPTTVVVAPQKIGTVPSCAAAAKV